MDAQEHSPALIPDPAAIVALVETLVAGMWPRSDFERKAFFQRLGFASGAKWDDASTVSATAHFALQTPLAGDLFSSWTQYHGKFMGVSMQPYTSMTTNDLSTRAGYEAIWAQLTAHYGEPANPWHDPVVPACVWNVNGRRVVIRFFNLQHSGMMLSVDDAGLAVAAATEAKRLNEPTHWNNSEEAVSPFVLPRLGGRV
ncbi:hypothetical protein [Arthrobacter glacialis]|uniref:Uncharacterized protein n=1 Tax=Arthrobacter glacialis TaxID=1664 RepID=A0A2S3ZZ32_ARTGL|nr:hypothetical protein [Arthrobacter glacialis]POH74289.1 hypothetical protein CVS27_06930 [Arthrobacter glacialis]